MTDTKATYHNCVTKKSFPNPSQIQFELNLAAGKDGGKAPTDLLGVGYDLHVDALAQGTAG